MTAQIFRNDQQPTFYVSDALALAPGGGISGTFQRVQVNATGLVPAIDIATTGVTAALSERFIDGAANTLEVGLNGTEASPSAFVFSSRDLKFGAGGVERLRIPQAGIANNPSATTALVTSGSTVVQSMALASNGVFVPAFTVTAGFAAPPSGLNIAWIRVGNVVHCEFLGQDASTTNGTNAMNISLPVPRSAPFSVGALSECSGFMYAAGNTTTSFGIFDPVPGTSLCRLRIFPTAGDAGVFIRGSFTYRLQ